MANGKGHFGPTDRNDGRDPFNQNSDRSDREKRTTSKGGPVFSKLFRLDRTDPLSFGPKFPEILVEWIAPDQTGHSGPPSKLVPNIPIGPNRNGPFHLMYYRNFGLNGKRPENQIVGVGSRCGRISQSQCTFPRFVIGRFGSSASDNLVFTGS